MANFHLQACITYLLGKVGPKEKQASRKDMMFSQKADAQFVKTPGTANKAIQPWRLPQSVILCVDKKRGRYLIPGWSWCMLCIFLPFIHSLRPPARGRDWLRPHWGTCDMGESTSQSGLWWKSPWGGGCPRSWWTPTARCWSSRPSPVTSWYRSVSLPRTGYMPTLHLIQLPISSKSQTSDSHVRFICGANFSAEFCKLSQY